MPNNTLLAPTTKAPEAPEASECGNGCGCATLPKIDELNPVRFQQMIDQMGDHLIHGQPQLTKHEALMELLFEMFAPIPEAELEAEAEDLVAEWDDTQIVLFAPAQLEDMVQSTLSHITGHDVHNFLKTVEELDEDSTFDLDPSNYHELIDQVKGAMSVLERSYLSILHSHNGNTAEAERAVQIGTVALISVYGYTSYVIVTAMVNVLAKMEMTYHG